MDTQTALVKTVATLPDLALTHARLVALAAPEGIAHPRVIQAIACHAARGDHLGLIIGHNRFALYDLTRAAYWHGFDPETVLTQIELSRAFTCYQLHHRIVSLDAQAGRRWSALYVLGLLDTFYDESVPYCEAARLLQELMLHLQKLARLGLPIAITASAPERPGRERLLDLVAQADEYVEFRDEPTSPYCGVYRQTTLQL